MESKCQGPVAKPHNGLARPHERLHGAGWRWDVARQQPRGAARVLNVENPIRSAGCIFYILLIYIYIYVQEEYKLVNYAATSFNAWFLGLWMIEMQVSCRTRKSNADLLDSAVCSLYTFISTLRFWLCPVSHIFLCGHLHCHLTRAVVFRGHWATTAYGPIPWTACCIKL